MANALRTYLAETRKPVYSAALILPFFVVYHTGTLVFRTTYVNGADALIVRLLALFSVRSALASALVLLAGFLVWQLRTRATWKLDSGRLALLFLESLGFACLLVLLSGWVAARVRFAASPEAQGVLERIVLYCGAGIYEELLFRALLVGLLLFLFSGAAGMRPVPAAAAAVVVAALIFALFHHLGPAGDPFTLTAFLQRTAAGIYFSMLFVTRGFGVTAVSHALYDVLVGVILA